MAKFSSPSNETRGGSNRPAVDPTAMEAMENAPKLTAGMSRKFDEETVLHVRDVVLPEAIEKNDVKVVRACEDLLQSWGMAVPNHVSGRWVPSEVPRNETMLREMFAHRMPEFGYKIILSREQFPDWLLVDKEGAFVGAEVEHRSSHFRAHHHDPALCDLIVCWEHNDPKCEVSALELFSGRVYEPEQQVERGDRSQLWITSAEGRVRGEERSRQSPKVVARQERAIVAYKANVAKYGKPSAAAKTAEQTGYSRQRIYALIEQLDL